MFSKYIIPNIYGKIAITITILLTTIAIYFGANHIYYFLILMSFIVLGIIAIAKIIEKCLSNKMLNLIKYISPIFLIIFVILACIESPNFYFRKSKKEDLVQYQFAKIINSKPNATLLNYGFLDGGFYTASNIIPNVKHFHKPNIKYENYPEIMDEQNRYIKEIITDFVVIRVEKVEDSYDIKNLYENYEKIKTVYLDYVNSYYILFKAKHLII